MIFFVKYKKFYRRAWKTNFSGKYEKIFFKQNLGSFNQGTEKVLFV